MPRAFVSLFGSGGDVLPFAAAAGIAPIIVQGIANVLAVDAATVSQAFAGNITSGNLLVVLAWGRNTGSDVVYTAPMLTQSAGTATIGTVSLEAATVNNNPGTNSCPAAIWTAPITGTGSCTIQISHAVGGWGGGSTRSMFMIFEVSLADVSVTRIAAAITASQDNVTAVSSGNVTTGGAGIIFGVFGSTDDTAGNTVTEDPAFTLGVEQQATAFDDGSIIYRTTTTNLTDSADWATSTGVYAAVCAVAIKAATP